MKTVALTLTAALAAMIAAPAQAAYTVRINQVGSDVVATGSGSIDFLGLTFEGFDYGGSSVNASAGAFLLVDSNGYADEYVGDITGPTSFGTGGLFPASSSSGAAPGSIGLLDPTTLLIPGGYSSGTPMSPVTATWANATLASLGLTSGTYVWNWDNGQGGDADSLTLDIGVPEPATWSVMMLGLFGLGGVLRARKGFTVA